MFLFIRIAFAAGEPTPPGEYGSLLGSTWYVQRSTAGTLIQTFGTTGDLPVPNAFVL